MVYHDQPRQYWQDEKLLKERLRLATTRLEDAQRERIWAIVAAREAGLSIRKIASATGLSPTRVHQLLNDLATDEITTWLSQLKYQERSETQQDTDPMSKFARRLESEVETLRWCLEWLDKLDRGEHVVVNLLPDCDGGRQYVGFDLTRIIQVLARIAADLDELQCNAQSNIELPSEPEDEVVRHRERLAEPEPKTPLSKHEQLMEWDRKMKLPPHLFYGER